MEYVFGIIASAIGVWAGSYLLDGVKLKGFMHAVIVVVVLAILNFTVGSVLKIVSLGILSWGVFNWFLDAILIQIADYFLDEFEVKNFWWALGLAAIISIIDGALRFFF
ncbi:MAG: phage holin family protein [Saprospiraceae bacterium]|nr:phage holin family protein [Saprospiraceae bacterium]